MVTFIITKATPTILIAYKTIIIVYELSAVKNTNGIVPSVKRVIPVIAILRAPYLSNKRPVIGDMIPIIKAPGNSINPE